MVEITYPILVGIVLLETLVLRALVKDVSHVYVGERLLLERSRVPKFHAPYLDRPGALTDKDLYGRESAILFVDTSTGCGLVPNAITSTIYVLWRRAEMLCIVCSGTPEQCRLLRDAEQLQKAYEGRVKVVVDESGELAARFGVSGKKTSAVMVDVNGHVWKTGIMADS